MTNHRNNDAGRAPREGVIDRMRRYVGDCPRLEREITSHLGVSEAVGAALLHCLMRRGEIERGPDGLCHLVTPAVRGAA